MKPQAWIAIGWLLIPVAAFGGLTAYAYMNVSFPGGSSSVYVAGLPLGDFPGYVGGQLCVALGGMVFAAALACFFQAARVRLRRAIRAVADDLGLDLDAPVHRQ